MSQKSFVTAHPLGVRFGLPPGRTPRASTGHYTSGRGVRALPDVPRYTYRHELAEPIRREHPPVALTEAPLAEGARRQRRHLRVVRLHAGARSALATARDRREGGSRTECVTGCPARGEVDPSGARGSEPTRQLSEPRLGLVAC